ncbi:DUF742 domain-containing protein [Streptomyces montanus]|uniref:DUF742 domain-containing protein n=1 Tax=Streptomyces montanus TaxID=2580423 RepID=A0A5R9FTZ2_9ACTN|nr:DUF742 domain-containing protein [Streptomyces montanus]TLS46099.1 DUF742 domain-containing protein [Streptomyces montanus]
MAAFAGRSWTRQASEGPAHFILTGGQTRPSRDLRVETLLTAHDPAPPTGSQIPEAEQAIALCRGQPSSVAEIAALVDLPVQITKVLLSRLMDAGALAVADKPATHTPDDFVTLLEAVRDGLQRSL